MRFAARRRRCPARAPCYILPHDAGVNFAPYDNFARPAADVKTNVWLLLFCTLLMARTAGTAKPTRPKQTTPAHARAADSVAGERWVRETLAKMTLDQKLGQLLVVYYYGGFTQADSADHAELVRDVTQLHVGGFILKTQVTPTGLNFSQAYPTAILANDLQRRAAIPLLVAADFERGTAMRLDEGTSFPHAMAVAATGEPADAYAMGRITAIEARAVGVNWVLAPDADVNSNPANPIINTRSFGEDPARVSEFVAAFVRGVEENGALATAKHFPGHGDTSTDSHLVLPTVTADRAQLDRVDLAPFRAAIAAGTSTIMTGHLAVLALDPDPSVPATLSPLITTDLLRKTMGFRGLVVTDAMDMGGVTAIYPPGEAAVRAVLAGADVLLIPPTPDAALAGLRAAVASGRIPMSRIDDAVTNILRAKAHLNLENARLVNVDDISKIVGKPEFLRTAQDIADRGVTLLADQQHVLPLDATRPLRVLLVIVSADPNPNPGGDFEAEIRPRVDSLQVLRADTQFARAAQVKLPPASSYDVAIAAVLVQVADRKGTVGLPDDEAALVNAVLSAGKPAIVACFGSPYLASRFPDAKTWIAAFSTADVAQRAVARAMFGQVAIGGRLPVTIPGGAALGAGMDVPANPMTLAPADAALESKLANAYATLDAAVADRAFPGGVLAVGYKDLLAVHAFGRQTYDATSPAVTADTMYDAASLTKSVVTTTLVAMLTESGQLDLDAPVARYIPEWAAGPQAEWRARVTLRHLLTHTSGLPAHEEFYKTMKTQQEMIAAICALPLEYEPGTQSIYTDLGFMLLGEIVQRVTGRPLDDLARGRIFDPLGMTRTMYRPPAALLSQIAPTENDTTWRKRLVHGEVHDENAFAIGGVAGHAGMFATAPDLAAFCQMLLDGGIYAHRRMLARSTIEEFTSPSPLAPATRTLGWMLPTADSASGHFFSPGTFGHLGFTGTSIWIDPSRNLFVVLLTNRVYPTRENEKIAQVRPAVHDAILSGLGLGTP
jgi:beta-glucosidase-like glycosyl hydrolase/CubicO group peptidase (beta-lactamase class C family)